MCCDGPDTSGQVAMAQANERLGNRAMDLAEQQYADQKPLQQEFMGIIRENAKTNQDVSGLQLDLARSEARRREEIFNPLEAALVQEANGYDSPQRLANEMGKADAAVIQAYERSIANAQRDQMRMGVNPNSAKALALRENAAIDLAGAAANASTAAGERIKAKGFGMRADMAGLGRNLATNQTSAAGSVISAGNATTGAFQSGVDQGNRNFSTTMGGFGTASGAFNNAGSLYGQAAEAEAASSPWNAIGKVAGIAAAKKC